MNVFSSHLPFGLFKDNGGLSKMNWRLFHTGVKKTRFFKENF